MVAPKVVEGASNEDQEKIVMKAFDEVNLVGIIKRGTTIQLQ